MSNRLFAFDALKFLSIFMVVMGHVYLFSFHNATNSVWQFINCVNMPMFMFISGFFSGKPTVDGVLKRIRTLLLPTLTVGFLYVFIKGISLDNFLFNGVHSGYWFCFSLFIFYLLYWIISIFSKKIEKCTFVNTNMSNLTLAFLFWGGGVILNRYYSSNIILNALSFPQFCLFFPYFVYGTFISGNNSFKKIIFEKNWMFSVSLVLLLIGTYVGVGYTISSKIVAISYINVMVYAFNRWYSLKANSFINYVSKRTIDIYLFHYFLLPSVYFIGQDMFVSNTNLLISIIIVGAVSAVVIMGTLVFTKFIETSAFLSFILLGKKK